MRAAFRSRGKTLALIWILLMACAGNPHGRSKDEWARARTVAEHYLRDTYGASWKITDERHGVPYMFSVETANEGSVLVHDNAVFTQRGMAGLDRFLRGSRCVEQKLPDVRDMTVVLRFFDAYPPDPNPPGYFRASDPHAQLRPQLEYLDNGRARLHLFYRYEDGADTDDHGEGEDHEIGVRVWTLTMDPGQMPVWTAEIKSWDAAKGQWVVDHTN